MSSTSSSSCISCIRYLVGDIGGTNSRLECVEISSDGDEKTIAEQIYPSQNYATLTSIIKLFLSSFIDSSQQQQQQSLSPVYACFAVAGPVQNNKARITNVHWHLDGAAIAEEIGLKSCTIINDFVGIGYGLLALNPSDVVPLNDVPPVPFAPKGCVGAGTGLGETYLTADAEGEYTVWPSEGGHSDYAARHDIEYRIMQFIKQKSSIPRVSVERAVSGLGIPMIFDFFYSEFPNEVNPEVLQLTNPPAASDPSNSSSIPAAPLHRDKSSVIAEYAEKRLCNLCVRTIDTFVGLYGAEAGNFALKFLPMGGLYIAGGIAPKLKWALLHDKAFMRAFLSKGRMQNLLEKVPVFMVIHPQVGLLGAKVICRRLVKKGGIPIQLIENKPINTYMKLIQNTHESDMTAHERAEVFHVGDHPSSSSHTPSHSLHFPSHAAYEAWKEEEKKRIALQMRHSRNERWLELGLMAAVTGTIAAVVSLFTVKFALKNTQK